ncbi:M23 family metallopeptidase [Edaphobacter sp. 12200R-103]|uniref:M23 family metallopeptidase n=1 Tax=Edaphobacter sp. 12200R-103 TaxID=2703788 RepID=UPI00192F085E|nr:M23 family metallopeptidase [Edaphobacter sp. 12200R-103]
MLRPHNHRARKKSLHSLQRVSHVSALLFLLFFIFSPLHAQQDADVSWTPSDLAAGSPALFTVHAREATSITGTWQNNPLQFFRAAHTPDTWYALAGVDVAAKPGSYPLDLQLTVHGQSQTIHRAITIIPADYKEITLSVPSKYVEPDAASLKIIASDQSLKRDIFASSAPLPLWTGSFMPPLNRAPRTDSFGTRRVFNGSLASIHRGLDYRARQGTPVHAVNSGRVVLARPLYFEGNCIVIDHGLGLTTIYMHLSKFRVKEGQHVTRGQLIALSGATGRANGPHLHLSVRWQGEYLDPAKLIALHLPSPAAAKDLPASAQHSR